MAEKLRIGIIGTGGIAHSHMRSYLQMDDVEIIGASDIVPGKARAFLDEFDLKDVPAFDNNDELLALKPDGVSVCSYNTQHNPCAIAAMKAGAHVLCEKPMSVHLEEAVEMAKVQKETGKILTIGFQPRYDPNMIMVKELVRSGILGDVYYIQTGGGPELRRLSQAGDGLGLRLRQVRQEPQVLQGAREVLRGRLHLRADPL